MIEQARAPYSIRLELTRRCNLRCAHCLADASPCPMEDELTTEEWLAFFGRLGELQVFGITLTGGEIFLRRDIFTLLERLIEARKHRVDILTNGTLISPGIARHLSALRLTRVTLSLDGMRDTHDRIRGPGSFDRALKGLRHLVAEGITPVISFTAMCHNYRDFAPLTDLVVAIGVSSIRVNKLTPEGRCQPLFGRLALGFPDDIRELVAAVERKRTEHPSVNITCTLAKHLFLPRASEEHCKATAGTALPITHLKDGCGACALSCQVTATGDVIPCEGLADFSAGNIRARDFLDLWRNSESFRNIRALSKVPVFTLPWCASCQFNRLCDGGCRAVAYGTYGDLLGPDPSCPYWHRELKRA